jgi:hypothetical protein
MTRQIDRFNLSTTGVTQLRKRGSWSKTKE